ncbi:MAG: tripartite tricarboxylate transporter substrate-binding protein, partial [Pseudomonadota bacterium]
IIVKKGRWNSIKELISDAKKNPGKLTYSTQGVNSNADFMVRLLEEQAGINLKMVPFPGNAETITALLGGHIDLAVVGGTGGLYQAGRIDVLASGQKERLQEYPNAPTLAELGYPIFLNANYFLCAPKGTPKEVLNKLYDAHQKAFTKYGPELTAMFTKFEMYTDFISPEEVDKYNKTKRDEIRTTVKKMGILVPNR